MKFVASHYFASITALALIVYHHALGSMFFPWQLIHLAAVYQYVQMQPMLHLYTMMILLILIDHPMIHLTNNLILVHDQLRLALDYYYNMLLYHHLIVVDDDFVQLYYHCCHLYHCHQCHRHSHRQHHHHYHRPSFGRRLCETINVTALLVSSLYFPNLY